MASVKTSQSQEVALSLRQGQVSLYVAGASLHQPFLFKPVLREVFFLVSPSVHFSGRPGSPDLGRVWGCY